MKKLLLLIILSTLFQGCAAYYRLISAIEDDDMETFQELVGREDVKINHQVMSGESLLHTAVRFNRIDMVDSLLNRNANPFALNASVESPLLLMLWDMRPELLQVFKKYDLDSNIKNESGRNYYFLMLDKFHKELEHNKENLIKYKILKDEYRSEFDTTLALRYDLNLDSLMMRLSFSVRELQRLGVNINAPDNDYCTPLIYASRINEVGLVAFLNGLVDEDYSIELRDLKKGAMNALNPNVFRELSKSIAKSGIKISSNDKLGNNVLLYSGLFSKTIVQILTMLGSDPYIQNHHRHNLLFKAIEGGHLELVKFCIESLAIDANAVDVDGNLPMHIAASGKEYKRETALIEKKPFFTINDENNNSLSRNEELVEILKYLITKTRNLNAQNLGGKTPLHVSLENKLPDFARILISSGTDLNLRTTEGKSGLDLMKENGYDQN